MALFTKKVHDPCLIRNNIYFTELRIIGTEWQGVEEIMGIQVEGLNIINIYNEPSKIFSANLLNVYF